MDEDRVGGGRMTLGSLFDGIGGFPLAAARYGIKTLWASEIEPYPIKVTKARFPQMKHLGSVLDVNGAEVEPVDIITFGSPCQDLSVAGKQAGLHKGERSNLFFEAIRIIKEMRESTNGKYPRIAVWENVPGAYSSNKGEDFRAVLQAFCQVCDPTADVPIPPKKWHKSGAIVGNGWSIAWRTFDAQFWGVPQRRRRIYLIADFGSERAGEVLFEPESVRGHSAESGTAREGAAADAEGSVGRGGQCLTPWDVQSRRVHDDSGAWPAIYGGEGGGHGYVLRQATPADAEGSVGGSCVGFDHNTSMRNGMFAFDEQANTLRVGGAGGGVCYAAAFKYGNSAEARSIGYQEEISPTLQAGEGGNQKPVVCYPIDSYQQDEPAKPPRKYIIRRLTPLECCRLQGFPDDWCSGLGTENPSDGEILFWAGVWETHRKILGKSSKPKSRRQIVKWLQDPYSDAAEYKMWGNGIALPNAAHVVGCAKRLMQGGNHED